MRSRTSRGVPEWSGGEDRYIGRRVLESGSVPGVPGYGQHDRKVFREPRQVLEGLMGRKQQGTSPWRAAPPPLGPMRLGLGGGNPRGGASVAWGASSPALAAAPPLDPI